MGSGSFMRARVRLNWSSSGAASLAQARVGLDLLHHAFAAFYRRDIYKVELGVDRQSLTGAQQLYERAGMHVAQRFARYKELRPAETCGAESQGSSPIPCSALSRRRCKECSARRQPTNTATSKISRPPSRIKSPALSKSIRLDTENFCAISK